MNKIILTFLLLMILTIVVNAQQSPNPELTRIKNEYNSKIQPKMPVSCVCHTSNIQPPDLSTLKNMIINKQKLLNVIDGKSQFTFKTMGAAPTPEFVQALKKWLLSIK